MDAIRTGASFARHKSTQTYGTDPAFVAAVTRHFGAIHFDLAADTDNRLASAHYNQEIDSLAQDWSSLTGTLWLNPPFSKIAPWAKKCRRSLEQPERKFDRILFLVPASVGSNWFAEDVNGHAFVLALNGRLTFAGCDQPFPKDCILAVFDGFRGFDCWNWRHDK